MSNSNNKKNEDNMIISMKNNESLNTSLIKFNTRNPPKIIINEYNNSLGKNLTTQNYSLNINQSNKNKSRNHNYSDLVVKNIIFAEHKVVSKILKKERKNYFNLLKNNENNHDISINEKINSFSKRIESGISIPSTLLSERKFNIDNTESYREKI